MSDQPGMKSGRARPKLALLRPFSPSDRAWLLERLAGCYDIIEPASYDEDTLAASVADADVALGAEITSKVLDSATRLRYVQTPGTGVEKLDLRCLEERGVMVCKSMSHAPQVAEHALAMLLALTRKVALHDRLLRGGQWYRPGEGADDELYQSDSLMGATVGLIGYGAINQAVARLLAGFGVRLLVHTRRSRPGLEQGTLDEMMARAAAVIVAVPLTDSTRGLIGGGLLDTGRTGPYLVNVSRAEVIERAPLLEALRGRTIRGAALDLPYGGVHGPEALADFARFDNVILSPHRAGTVRGMAAHLGDVVANLESFYKGLPLKNVVDAAAGY